MSLLKGGKATIGPNIKTELAAGAPKKQAVAIALNVARKGGADIPKPVNPARRGGIDALRPGDYRRR